MREASIPESVFLLVLLSAFFHAVWNLAARKVKGDLGVLVAAMLFGTVFVLVPCGFAGVSKAGAGGDTADAQDTGVLKALPYIVVTGVSHAGYVLLLGLAYRVGDLSTVYPIVRGWAVAATAVAAVLLLGENISVAGGLGIALVVCGIVSVSRKSRQLCGRATTASESTPDEATAAPEATADTEQGGGEDDLADVSGVQLVVRDDDNVNDDDDGVAKAAAVTAAPMLPRSRRNRGIFLALCAGSCTATYSVNDKVGVTKMDPAWYMVGMNCVGVSIELLYMLWTPTRREGLLNAVRVHKKYIFVIGIGGVGCYLMILSAFTLSEFASYVVALRECSIVFGSLMGFIFLGEPVTATKLLGIALITVGVLTIKWA